MFHSHDGWFFERLDDGSVGIYHIKDSDLGQSEKPLVIIPASVWPSIVASVSKDGEWTASRYFEAAAFHGV